MNDKVKEAQEAWKSKAINQSPFAGRHLYYMGIEDYKQALKRDIENKMSNYKNGSQYHVIKAQGMFEILELLDTVKP